MSGLSYSRRYHRSRRIPIQTVPLSKRLVRSFAAAAATLMVLLVFNSSISASAAPGTKLAGVVNANGLAFRYSGIVDPLGSGVRYVGTYFWI